jgi:hypothetical protein
MPRRRSSGAIASIRATSRAAAGGDDDPGQQQAGLRPAAVAVRQPEDQQHGAEGAGEGQPVDGERRQAEQHGEQSAGAGAAGNAENVGIGERVAQQHLHQRAGQRQQAAAGEAGEGARQAQFADDVGTGRIAPEQRGDDVARRDRDAARRQRRPETRQCQQHEDGEDQDGAAAVGHQRKL